MWSIVFLSTTHRQPPKFVEYYISVQCTYGQTLPNLWQKYCPTFGKSIAQRLAKMFSNVWQKCFQTFGKSVFQRFKNIFSTFEKCFFNVWNKSFSTFDKSFCNRFSVVDVWSMKIVSTTGKNLNVMRLCVFVVVWSKKTKNFFCIFGLPIASPDSVIIPCFCCRCL